MKILVTGGSGMVARNLKDIVVNDDNQWLFPSSKELNLLIPESIDKYFSDNNPDFVVHLAANVGGLFKNLKYKVEMFRENILMNENILYYCHKYNVQNGIFCCSTCIYPYNPPSYPMTEDMIMEGVPHPSNDSYGYSKRFMYFQCMNYNKQYNRKYICISPCNIYGKYDNYNLENSHVIAGLIHKFYIASKSSDKSLEIKTGLNSQRQFINAIDVSLIIVKMVNNYSNLTINNIILADDDVYITYVIDIISKCFGGVKYTIIDLESGQVKKTCSNKLLRDTYPDIKLMSINTGVADTINWFLKNYPNIRL